MKRDRETFETNTCTYMFQPQFKKHEHQQTLCATAMALVENPKRLAAYVNQLSDRYLQMFVEKTIPLTAMTLVLLNNNHFWYLVRQRLGRKTI